MLLKNVYYKNLPKKELRSIGNSAEESKQIDAMRSGHSRVLKFVGASNGGKAALEVIRLAADNFEPSSLVGG